MKSKIQPQTYKTTVVCACGNSFETLSTKKEIQTEICSACHPFFTGKQKLVDAAHRVEKFQAKEKKFQEKAAVKKHGSKKEKHAARLAKKTGQVKKTKKSAKDALKAAKSALSGL